MKESKKQFNLLNKISYSTVIMIIFVVAAISLLYSLRIRHNQELVKQQITKEQTNEVSGKVSTQEKQKEEKKESTIAKKEEKKEASAKVSEGYDGKQKLEWPLLGNVIIPYSMDTTVYFETLDQYQCNSGLFIQAAENTKVKTVYKGIVKKVTKDDKYGTMITVDMGGNYTATYGQIQKAKVKAGDKVEAGETIGYVAKPTKYFTLEGSHLYFEVEKDGKSMNPVEILQ
ncbi:MAG: peptidoglycan DD-metalloendopeptidase family protein [Lachnospiraceae bacterium]